MLNRDQMEEARYQAKMENSVVRRFIESGMEHLSEGFQFDAKIAFACEDIMVMIHAIGKTMITEKGVTETKKAANEYLELVLAGMKSFCEAHGIEVEA